MTTRDAMMEILWANGMRQYGDRHNELWGFPDGPKYPLHEAFSRRKAETAAYELRHEEDATKSSS